MIPLPVKYRPSTFDSVVEQDSIKRTLQNQINKNKIKNVYLFCGSAGTGKTTTARLFAYALNGAEENVCELDAASHSSVENVRTIIDDSKYHPVGTPYKIYIIDECHALSSQAWKALLKTLEEPTKTSIFIMCTTDPQKVPVAVMSRAQRFDFKKISHAGIVSRLKWIIEQENSEGHSYTYTDEAIEYIAKLAEGGMRTAITRMSTVLDLSDDVTTDTVVEAISTVSYDTLFDLLKSLCIMDKKKVIQIIEQAHMSGTDLKQLMQQFTDFTLEMNMYGLFNDFEYLHIPPTYKDKMSDFSDSDYAFFTQLLEVMLKLCDDIKWNQSPKSLIEATFLLLCTEA